MSISFTRHPASRRVKILAWGNILFQLLFPLSLSFTPVMAAVPTSLTSLTSNASIPTTAPYVLGVGENVDTVAKKHGISVDELKKINVYRTFSKPFASLTVGDELEVPRRMLPFSVDNDKTNTDRDASSDSRLAGYAQTGVTALAAGDAAKSAASMARSAANNEFNSSAQQWLSQFGTARVQLNVNEDFHLDGSALDVLVPLYDNQASILFTQLGARNKDSRNTLNIGAGVRTFQGDWMYGINTFFDNDVTGKNRRVGVGAEAWTDYLKLSANSYFGTTDWHQSRDFADYNERPANGYDVRAEAYLPAYPKLGGKLMYEQYRGDEVALFGKDERQKNPHAITAGINYTPVPLFTVGAEHRAGNGSHNDSRINVQFNYRLGESWQSHIDPSRVAASRTLAGSRYDLVERNNNIVLDYQKQDLIRLTLPEQVTGEPSSSATVHAQVTSKYGLERIEWDSAGLMAAGGNLVQVSPQAVSVTLPPYQATRSSNSHTLSAVAYDRQGNASPRATMQIVVIPGTGELTAGNLTVTSNNAVANGVATNAVQALVTDAGNQPMANQKVSFSADNGAAVTTVIGTTGADGIATATLTSTTAGISNVTASVNGSSRSVVTTFIADDTTAVISDADFTVGSGAAANGTAPNALSATVKDGTGNAVPNVAVTFTVTSGAATPATQTVQTDANGVATANLVSLVAAGNQVTATVGANTTVAKTSTFIADDTTAVISDADFTVGSGAAANGTAPNALSATVKDGTGNAVPNVAVTFTVTSGAATPATQTVQTDANGVATANLVSLVAAGNQVTATVGANTTVAKTSTFIADDTTAVISDADFTVGSGAVANGTAPNALSATVKDGTGNAVPNVAVTFTVTSGAATPATQTVQTDANGVATANLVSLVAAGNQVTATVGANTTVAKTSTFIADDTTAVISDADFTVGSGAAANGTAPNALSATVKDGTGNAVPNVAVTFTVTSGAATPATQTVQTDANGVATANLVSLVAAGNQVTATVGANTTVAKTSTFIADDTTAVISDADFTVGSGAAANGTAPNALSATVKDGTGNAVPNVAVTFTVTSGAATPATQTVQTDANGVATANLVSLVAAGNQVTATVGANTTVAKTSTFIADDTTAVISDADFTVGSGAVANGTAPNALSATVKDGTGNAVPNVAVTFTVTSGAATPATQTVQTDANGVATANLVSLVAAGNQVTATVGANTTVAKTSTFIADDTTAVISDADFTVGSGAAANGTAPNALSATVKDGTGNAVPNVAVTFTVTSGAATPATQTVQTDANGVATANLVSLVAAGNQVTATVGANTTVAKTSTFIADDTTAVISDADFTVGSGAVANGTAPNALSATVKDGTGNAVPNVAVTFTVTSGAATPATQTVQTDANGVATANLVSLVAAGNQVTATVGANTTVAKTSTFIADDTTAVISDADFTVGSGAAANGTAPNALSATVKDGTGNAVPNVAVTFTVTSGAATPATQTVQTDANGVATANLVSLVAAGNQVTATVGANTTVAKTSTFIADDTTAVISDADFTVGSGAAANGTAPNALSATVKDGTGNAVPNVAVTFTVTSGAATPATQTVQTDANGVATANLVSLVAAGNQVTATVGANTTAAKTSTFVRAFTGVSVNGTTFALNDGFPSTGFTGAEFSLTVTGAASDYTWSSSASSWAPVDSSGKVSFTSQGNGSPVTITATPTGGGTPLTYIFTVGSWFINNGGTKDNRANASAFCRSIGFTQPTRGELTQGLNTRGVGSLWSEWGSMLSYGGSGFNSDYYWTSEADGTDGRYYYVVLGTGEVSSFYSSLDYYVVCRQGL